MFRTRNMPKNGIRSNQSKIINTETLEELGLKFVRLPPIFLVGLFLHENK